MSCFFRSQKGGKGAGSWRATSKRKKKRPTRVTRGKQILSRSCIKNIKGDEVSCMPSRTDVAGNTNESRKVVVLEIFGDSFGRLLRRFLESCSWRISLSSVTVVAYNACGGCVRGSSCFQVLSAKRNRWYGSSPVLTVCVAPTPQLLACWKAKFGAKK